MLDLTLAPSFKVKQWFTGFGELSFRWIQICIDLRCVGLVLLFPPSAVRDAWLLVISRKSVCPIFTKFDMGVYWVNSFHGIAVGEDSSIAN